MDEFWGQFIETNVIVEKENENYRSWKMRHETTQQTPLMIAACMGREDLYDALFNKNPTAAFVKDHPTDDLAWSAQDYYIKYIQSK